MTTLKHLACIMDGNRRWAKKKGWLPWYGHREGIAAAKRTIAFCINNEIPMLTLYVFSLENAKRSPQELEFLFDILVKEVYSQLDEFIEKGICIQFIGDRALFPENLRPIISDVQDKTKYLSALRLNLLFFYGGRQEIVSSIKELLSAVKKGTITEQDISVELVEQYLWTKGFPAPDMIIRTGGQRRLSNFLLFQSAYSELYFLDCLWPDLMTDHLDNALQFFNQCQRNFGK